MIFNNILVDFMLILESSSSFPGEWIFNCDSKERKSFIDKWGKEYTIFLIESAKKMDLIEYIDEFEIHESNPDWATELYNKSYNSFRITPKGYNFINENQKSGNLSNNCFVAMSFGESEYSIYNNAIKPALIEMNYNPIRVDEINSDVGQTINDLIISEIKRSKFMIADLTKQKNGVYFEAGYCMGQNKKVILTCNKSDFPNVHFDLNHYPIIIYNDNMDLKEKIKLKIETYIDE